MTPPDVRRAMLVGHQGRAGDPPFSGLLMER